MKVRIGSTKYDMEISKELVKIDDEDAVGAISDMECKLLLTTAVPVQTRKQSFWHEVVHGIFFELGNDELAYNEGIVDGISKLLYGFHEDNKLDKIYEALSKQA